MAKKYRLLKDLPTIESGRIFEETKGSLGGTLLYATGFCSDFTIDKDGIENFDEWFEEVGEPEWVYYINAFGGVVDNVRVADLPGVRASLKSTGNYFETKEEAEKYLAYLKAKAIIKKDAKGFKPDWEDEEQPKYYGYWNFKEHEPEWSVNYITKIANIYFKSYETLEESFEKHPKEWKTYLTYEQ